MKPAVPCGTPCALPALPCPCVSPWSGFFRFEGLTAAGLRDERARLCVLLGPKRAPERMPRNRGVGRERK